MLISSAEYDPLLPTGWLVFVWVCGCVSADAPAATGPTVATSVERTIIRAIQRDTQRRSDFVVGSPERRRVRPLAGRFDDTFWFESGVVSVVVFRFIGVSRSVGISRSVVSRPHDGSE